MKLTKALMLAWMALGPIACVTANGAGPQTGSDNSYASDDDSQGDDLVCSPDSDTGSHIMSQRCSRPEGSNPRDQQTDETVRQLQDSQGQGAMIKPGR